MPFLIVLFYWGVGVGVNSESQQTLKKLLSFFMAQKSLKMGKFQCQDSVIQQHTGEKASWDKILGLFGGSDLYF